MRKSHISIAITFIILGLFVWQHYTAPKRFSTRSSMRAAAATPLDTSVLYPVTRVIDGDTIDIQKDGKFTRVRLIGIDTPEVVDPRKPVQCFGREASNEAHRILDGKEVSIETDPSQDTYDKYGRLLAYVFLPDPSKPLGTGGTFVNEYMVAQGYAHEYTYNLPYKYQAAFKSAERTAREHQLGLWAPDTCNGDTKQVAKNI